MGIHESGIRYEERIVAFIDILGFKNIIQESEKDLQKLTTINKVLQYLKNHESSSLWGIELMEIEEDAQKKDLKKFSISDTLACTCFSDSIVVSVKIETNLVNEIASSLIAKLSLIGAQLLTEGILIRGGITIGNLIHSGNGVVMGKALIEAYELELKVAKQARIVLSNKLLGRLNFPLTTKSDRYPYHQYLSRFNDGCVGFHQMIIFQVIQNSTQMEAGEIRKKLAQVRKVIITGLDFSFELPDVFQKYQWLMEEYNNLIILDKDIKFSIHGLNEDIPGHNVHYAYTDDFHYKKSQQ